VFTSKQVNTVNLSNFNISREDSTVGIEHIQYVVN